MHTFTDRYIVCFFQENQEKEKDNDDPASCKLKASEGRKSVRFIDEEVSETEDDDKSGDDYDGYSKTEMDEKDNNYDLRDAEDEDVENNELEGALKTTRDLFKDSDDNKTEDENKMSTFEKNEKKVRCKKEKTNRNFWAFIGFSFHYFKCLKYVVGDE